MDSKSSVKSDLMELGKDESVVRELHNLAQETKTDNQAGFGLVFVVDGGSRTRYDPQRTI